MPDNPRFKATLKGGQNPNLTPRELEVTQLVVTGIPTAQIAVEMGCSYETAKQHLYSATRKLGVPNRTSLAILAVVSGLVALPEWRREVA